MVSASYSAAYRKMTFLGDIWCEGILKKGLSKVGSTPDTATPEDVIKAIDAHIEPAMISFVGPVRARQVALDIRRDMERLKGG